VLSSHDGTLFVGNNCGGLSIFDGERFKTYAEKDGLSNSCVWSLAEDSNHDIWIGTWGGGIYRFRDGHFTQYGRPQGLPSLVIFSIAAARDGSLWIATQEGLSHMQDGRFRNYTVADGLSSDRIVTVYQDRGGGIWAGTSAGIDRLAGDRFVPLRGAPESEDIPYGPLLEDSSGTLYALSHENGVSRIENNRLVSVDEALQPSGMVESGGREFWFGARDGIFRVGVDAFKRQELDRDSPLDYTSFGRADGLNSKECSSGQPNMAITPDGRLWVATAKGLAMLDLPRLPKRSGKPAIFIEQVDVGREKIVPGPKLVLRPGAYHVALRFTALDLASPENVRLQYRLDGVDTAWLDADSTRTAIYTDIPVGVHSFHIRASNGAGIWDREGIVYEVTQQPYFYQTAACRLAVAVSVCLLLFGLHRFRLRQAAARSNARLEERLSERERMARELHDTLLQGFQGLMLRLQAGLDLLPPGKGREQIEKALEKGDEAIVEGRAAIHDMRSSTVVTNDLADAVKALGDELASEESATFHVVVEGAPRDLHPIMRDEIYRIAREAVRNAFHHARARRIEAEITYDDRHLRVRIRDDGGGIDPGILKGGRGGHYGLPGMRERARRIGGQLNVWTGTSEGTEIELNVPGPVAYGTSSWWTRLQMFGKKTGGTHDPGAGGGRPPKV
jgi:signal transduction histidine kinase